MQSWSWCSSSSSSQIGTTQTKVVRTSIRNGEKVVTTTYSDQPQSISFREPQSMQQISTAASSKAAAPAKQTAPATSRNQFEKDCLEEHNRLRALHGCPPLQLNRTLCAYATEWAKKLGHQNSLEHRSQRKYGENLFMASGYNVNGEMVVKSWYDEIAQYNYSRPGFSGGTGHFTQVVWMGSRDLGIGVETRGNTTWVVANYDPPGNFTNEFQKNVPKRLR